MKNNRLLNLIKDNESRGASLEVRCEGDTADVYIYDVIDDWWGISAKDFAKELESVDAANVTLHVNCPGGSIFDARSMQAAIANHPAQFTANIEGLAASAATFLVMACDTIRMSEGSMFMIHEGWSLMIGNKRDFSAEADLLEKLDNTIASDYAKRTGMDADAVMAAMEAETWYTAEEAKEAGFVDEVFETVKTSNQFDLSAYENAPEQQKPDNRRAILEKRIALLERVRR